MTTNVPSRADHSSVKGLMSQLTPSLKLKFEKLMAEELGLVFTEKDPVWAQNREVLITGGIRSGKSIRLAFKALCKLLDPATRLIWLVGPDYPQAREEFRYIMEWCMKLGLIEDANRDISMPAQGPRTLVTITGCRVETRSAQHPERLASVSPDMIVLCEPGQMSAEVYEMSKGRLLQRRGDLWMGGTLEADLSKPHWQWYEDKANDWFDNGPEDRQRSFTLPTWANLVDYPLGENDPELQHIKATSPEYVWNRRYAGLPTGVQDPVFPFLWSPRIKEDLFRVPEDWTEFAGGAIGVDVGFTLEHPSAIVAVNWDNYGRLWVRECWKGFRVGVRVIQDVVDSFKEKYDIWDGCCDPNQSAVADMLGFAVASGGAAGGIPSSTRFRLANELLESYGLMFDEEGPLMDELWASLRSMGYVNRKNGKRTYERPLGDDLGQALMYAIELLRTDPFPADMTLSMGRTSIRNLGEQRQYVSRGRA